MTFSRMHRAGVWVVLATLIGAATVVAQDRSDAGRRDRGRRPPPPPPQQADQQPQPPDRPAPPPRHPPRPAGMKLETTVLALTHARAREIAGVVVAAISDDLTRVVPHERTNALIVSGPPQTVERVRGLVEQLDQPAETDRGEAYVLEVIALRGADAQEVAHYVEQVVRMTLAPLVLNADRHANTVWLSGPPEQVAQFAELAKRIDTQTIATSGGGGPNTPELRFYQLERTQAAPLASTVNMIMNAMEMEVRAVADPQSNTMVVYATAEQHERIAKIVEALDVESKVRSPHRATRSRGGEQTEE